LTYSRAKKRKEVPNLLICSDFADVNWGSSTQAQSYKSALTAVHRLINVHDHVKNYQPQILVLSGKPQDRPPLVDLAHLITKNGALMVCGHVLEVRTPLPIGRPSNGLSSLNTNVCSEYLCRTLFGWRRES
jgi:hypothetical protein